MNEGFSIESSSFKHGGAIPEKHTCEGENINPSLTFRGVPDNTMSLVLIMEDPDVPKELQPDGIFDHWVVFNMPPETFGIPEGTTPPGQQGRNSKGSASYTGPCPPNGEHRYFFKLFALDTQLSLPEGATKAQVLGAMLSHQIATAELMGTYIKKEDRK